MGANFINPIDIDWNTETLVKNEEHYKKKIIDIFVFPDNINYMWINEQARDMFAGSITISGVIQLVKDQNLNGLLKECYR